MRKMICGGVSEALVSSSSMMHEHSSASFRVAVACTHLVVPTNEDVEGGVMMKGAFPVRCVPPQHAL